MGRTHRSFFRVNAIDSRSPRDGKVIEELGWYDPCCKDPEKQVELKLDRIRYWLSVGAQPSETVGDLLKRNGVEFGKNKSKKKAEPTETAPA